MGSRLYGWVTVRVVPFEPPDMTEPFHASNQSPGGIHTVREVGPSSLSLLGLPEVIIGATSVSLTKMYWSSAAAKNLWPLDPCGGYLPR
jgi:hypothetical protein